MTIQQAIEKAIEGGWRPIKYVDYQNKQQVSGLAFIHDIYIRQAAFLDPIFWQSLGKAMGWDETSHLESPYCWYYKGIYRRNLWGAEWEYNQHRFIDHLAEGKDAESFFEPI